MRHQSIALQSYEADDPAAALSDCPDGTGGTDETPLPPLAARFLLRDGREFSCLATHFTTSGAHFQCHVPIPEGSSLIAYVEGVGRVEGVTGEAADEGFPVHFSLKGPRLTRLEQNLHWLSLKQRGLASEERHGTRFQPGTGTARVTLGSGEEHGCEVLDMSLSGAAIRTDARPEVGSCVLLGRMRGRVVRHLADGFAIEFMAPLQQGELHHSLR